MEEKTIEIDYQSLKLKITTNFRKGEEESILFMHGLGCSKDSFKDIWDFPEFKKYTILIFDLVGFGDSSKPKEFSYTMEDQAEVCKLLIEKLHLDKIHLVGHSMGGAIGLLLAEKIPEKTVSFVNLEGNLTPADCTISRKAIGVSQREFEKSIYDKTKKELVTVGGKDVTGREDIELWLDWLSKSPAHVFYKTSISLMKWSDSGKLLKKFIDLELKKCYIFGYKNKDIPTLAALHEAEPNIPLVPISSAGHFMMLHNPQEFYQKLAEFLSIR